MGLQPGTQVDRYIVEGLLGEGAMAAVYRVRHVQLGTPFALKVLTIQGKSIRTRMLQEGRIQASIRHANIVSVNDVIEVDGSPALVMEMVDGPPLDQVLASKRLTIKQADDIGRAILSGVAEAHRRGLVHRDLKPSNVLVHRSPAGPLPKVSDFGIAKVLHEGGDSSPGSAKTRTGMQLGTPLYMAPEQIEDAKNVDARADVFALGAIMYELLAGKRAFERPTILAIYNAITNGDWTPIDTVVPNVPDRMVHAITKALTVDKAQRFADAGEMLRAWTGADAAADQWDDLLGPTHGPAVFGPTLDPGRVSGEMMAGASAETMTPNPTMERTMDPAIRKVTGRSGSGGSSPASEEPTGQQARPNLDAATTTGGATLDVDSMPPGATDSIAPAASLPPRNANVTLVAGEEPSTTPQPAERRSTAMGARPLLGMAVGGGVVAAIGLVAFAGLVILGVWAAGGFAGGETAVAAADPIVDQPPVEPPPPPEPVPEPPVLPPADAVVAAPEPPDPTPPSAEPAPKKPASKTAATAPKPPEVAPKPPEPAPVPVVVTPPPPAPPAEPAKMLITAKPQYPLAVTVDGVTQQVKNFGTTVTSVAGKHTVRITSSLDPTQTDEFVVTLNPGDNKVCWDFTTKGFCS